MNYCTVARVRPTGVKRRAIRARGGMAAMRRTHIGATSRTHGYDA